jgi:hypothetical protein
VTTPYKYRVVARNTVGYGNGFPTLTASSMSGEVGVNKPAAPSNLAATLLASPTRVGLTWRDNAVNESGFVVERSSDNGQTFTTVGTPGPRNNTGNVTFTDTTVTQGSSYVYRVTAVNFAGSSDPATASVVVDVPPAPQIGTALANRQGSGERVTVTWSDVTGETGYEIQWSSDAGFGTVAGSGTAAANATSFTTGNLARTTWYVRVRATNVLGPSGWSAVLTVPPAA